MQSKTTTFSLIALCALLGALLLWRIAAGNAEKTHSETRISALERQLAGAQQLPAPASEAPRQKKPPIAPLVLPPSSESMQHNSSVALTKLNGDLAEARTRISDLESKVLSLDADRATLTQQRQQELTAAEETCRTRVADTQRSLETAQADLKAAQQRAALFESENENLRKAQAASIKAAPRATPSADGELDELSRRRETYLKSLIRRYREIDNDYRGMLRDSRDSQTNDAAILRVQATLSQAEEDLRQIDALNAKTLLVEKHTDQSRAR